MERALEDGSIAALLMEVALTGALGIGAAESISAPGQLTPPSQLANAARSASVKADISDMANSGPSASPEDDDAVGDDDEDVENMPGPPRDHDVEGGTSGEESAGEAQMNPAPVHGRGGRPARDRGHGTTAEAEIGRAHV